jgi:CIC family chloride channel protein
LDAAPPPVAREGPWQLSAKQIALGQAIAIGLAAGVSITVFRLLMGAVGTWRNHLAFGPGGHAWLVLPLAGALGGALAGQLVARFAPEAKGSGIPYVKLALARPGTPMRLASAWTKLIGASVGIGAGLSLGREGPSVQIGACMGAAVARWHDGSRAHRRQLIAAGAGAGLAAAFNAPIAGVLFVVEEMLQEVSSLTLGSAILASVTAAVVARLIGGGAFVYHLPPADFMIRQLPLYGFLGLVCGVLGPCFTWAILRALALSRAAGRFVARPWHAAVAGLATGAVGTALPAVLGGSYDLVERSLFGAIPLAELPAVFVGKLACTALAYGSGAPGGIFSPSLVLGALAGLGVGSAGQAWAPWLVPSTAGFAFCGMGAFFAATARAPVTAAVLVFELTGDYGLILPLMTAVVIAALVSEMTGQESIYHALLRQDGVMLETAPNLSDLHARTVAAAMSGRPEVVVAEMPLDRLADHFARSRHNGFPLVAADGRLVGMVTKRDLLDALEGGLASTTPACEVGSLPGVRIAEDASLAEAWEVLRREGVDRLAVVAAGEPDHLVGVLTRVNLFHQA